MQDHPEIQVAFIICDHDFRFLIYDLWFMIYEHEKEEEARDWTGPQLLSVKLQIEAAPVC